MGGKERLYYVCPKKKERGWRQRANTADQATSREGNKATTSAANPGGRLIPQTLEGCGRWLPAGLRALVFNLGLPASPHLTWSWDTCSSPSPPQNRPCTRNLSSLTQSRRRLAEAERRENVWVPRGRASHAEQFSPRVEIKVREECELLPLTT